MSDVEQGRAVLRNGLVSGFTQFPNIAFYANLTALEVAHWLYLLSLTNNANEDAFPSYNMMAKRVKCVRNTSINTIKSLIEKGWISKETRTNSDGSPSVNEYTLMIPPEYEPYLLKPSNVPEHMQSKDYIPPSANGRLGGASNALGGVVQEMHQGSALDAPGVVQEMDPTNTHLDKDSKAKTRARESTSSKDQTPDWLVMEIEAGAAEVGASFDDSLGAGSLFEAGEQSPRAVAVMEPPEEKPAVNGSKVEVDESPSQPESVEKLDDKQKVIDGFVDRGVNGKAMLSPSMYEEIRFWTEEKKLDPDLVIASFDVSLMRNGSLPGAKYVRKIVTDWVNGGAKKLTDLVKAEPRTASELKKAFPDLYGSAFQFEEPKPEQRAPNDQGVNGNELAKQYADRLAALYGEEG